MIEPSHRFAVVRENRLEDWLFLQGRILGGHYLGAVESEGRLDVNRLFAPQRAVVVERGDSIGWWNEFRTSFRRHAGSRTR